MNACSHQASVLGMYPFAPGSHMTIRCGLLEKQNGLIEDSLFLRADLRTILFSACSVVRPLFYYERYEQILSIKYDILVLLDFIWMSAYIGNRMIMKESKKITLHV